MRWKGFFGFASNPEAEARLRREVALLAFLKPRVTMPLPQMVLHEGPVPFSQHLKLPRFIAGKPQYLALDEAAVTRSPPDGAALWGIARVAAQPHAVGWRHGVDPWMSPDELIVRTEARLPRGYRRGFLKRAMAAYRKLTIAGDELVYGYFERPWLEHGIRPRNRHAQRRVRLRRFRLWLAPPRPQRQNWI